MPTFVDPVLRSALEAIEHHGAANVVLTYAQCRALFHRLRELEATACLGKGEKPDPATDWRRLGSNAVIDAALSTAGPGARVHTAYDDAADGPMTVDIEGREGVVLTITRQAIPLRHERDALFKVERVGQPGGRLLTAVALPWADVLWLVKEWATPEQTTLDGSTDWRPKAADELIAAALGSLPPGARANTEFDNALVSGPITVTVVPSNRVGASVVIARTHARNGVDLFMVEVNHGADGARRTVTVVDVTWGRVLAAVKDWAVPPEKEQTTLDGSADWRTCHMLAELADACAGPGHVLSREDRTVPGTPGVRGGGKLCTVESFIRIVVMDRPQMRFEVRLVGVGGPGGSGAPCDCFSCRCTYDGSTFATELAMTWVGVLGAVRRWSTEAGVLRATLKPKPPERQKDAIDEQLAAEVIAETMEKDRRAAEEREAIAEQRAADMEAVRRVAEGPAVQVAWPHTVRAAIVGNSVEVDLSGGQVGPPYLAVFRWNDHNHPKTPLSFEILRAERPRDCVLPSDRVMYDNELSPCEAVRRYLSWVASVGAGMAKS